MGPPHHPARSRLAATMADLPRPLGTYTTRATRVVGWGLLGALALTAVLASVRLGVEPGLLAWLALLAAVVWVGILRPRVEADHTGVHVRNLLRDHTVPWPLVASFGERWALEVFTPDARRISSWAIPTRRDIRGAMRARRDLIRAERRGAAGAPPSLAQERERFPRVDAASVKESLELAQLEWKRGDYGHPPAAPAGETERVSTSWPWQAWVPLAVSVVAVVLTSL